MNLTPKGPKILYSEPAKDTTLLRDPTTKITLSRHHLTDELKITFRTELYLDDCLHPDISHVDIMGALSEHFQSEEFHREVIRLVCKTKLKGF